MLPISRATLAEYPKVWHDRDDAMNDDWVNDDLLDPARLAGLDLPPKRLREVAESFEAIRKQIEKMRELDLGGTHPAVVYRGIRETSDE